MSSNDTPAAPLEKVGPNTKEELMEQGWPEEQADFLAALDACVQGRDVSIVIPVSIMALQNLTSICTAEAMRQIATLFSEAAFAIGQRAAEAERGEEELARQELEELRRLNCQCPKCGNDDFERPEGEDSDRRHCLGCGHDFNLPPVRAAQETTEQPPEAPAPGTLR